MFITCSVGDEQSSGPTGRYEQGSPDWLSMLLFVPDYIRRLIELGHLDAARQHEQIAAFLAE